MLKSYKYRPSGVSDFFFCDSERSLNWWAPEGFICINICINITLLENPDSASIKELNTKVYALKFKCDVPSIANKICIHVCVVCNLFRPCWSACGWVKRREAWDGSPCTFCFFECTWVQKRTSPRVRERADRYICLAWPLAATLAPSLVCSAWNQIP